MTAQPLPASGVESAARAPWLPMVVIVLGEMIVLFNVAAVPVSMGGMVRSFGAPPTAVGTAIVVYSFGVSGFVMLGAKLGQRLGARLFFRSAVGLFLGAMVLMAVSPRVEFMYLAQGLAGLAAAGLMPTLVALVAVHYHGRQQEVAVGWLGAVRAVACVLALVTAGYVASIGWRLAFALLAVLAAVVFMLSARLRPVPGNAGMRIDAVGVALAVTGLLLVTFGFNNLHSWGVLLARPGAPFDVLGVSPAPVMIAAGGVLRMAFFGWSCLVARSGGTPLLAVTVFDSPKEWAALVALFVAVGIEAAINFAVPLYIQIIQGRGSVATSVAMMPFLLSVFFAAILTVRTYGWFAPRQIARGAYGLVIAGLLWLAFVVRSDWGGAPVVVGLAIVGFGQGALVTLLFNVLVTSAPTELAGDVGSLRAITQNVATGVGTAVMGTIVIAALNTAVLDRAANNPLVTAELKAEVGLDGTDFLDNEHLKRRFESTDAAPAQVAEAVRINSEARLQAMKAGFVALAGFAALVLVPCGWLPDYRHGEDLAGAGCQGARGACRSG